MGNPHPSNPIPKGPSPRRKIKPRLGTALPKDFKNAMGALDQESIQQLAKIMRSKRPTLVKLKAIEMIIERNHGKVPLPIQPVGEFSFRLLPSDAPPEKDADADK